MASGTGRKRVTLPLFTPTSLDGAELSARTVGRARLIQRVIGLLRTAATSGNRPHTLLVGPRGSGKTHALAVVLHEAGQDEEIARQLAFAWIPEDAVGISSYEDLLLSAVEYLLDDAPGGQAAKQLTLDRARGHRAAHDALSLEELVRNLLDGRVLVLVLENLDRIFGELGDAGQARLRAFMETTGDLLLLASAPLLFDAVSDRNRPWFASFHVEHLDELSVEDGALLLERIAGEGHDEELARFLKTDAAQARMRAVSHLAGGSPRMWMVLAGCMTIELLDELAPLVEAMLDQLAPYYQARLLELPPVERKLIAELCRTATLSREGRVVHEQRGMRTVGDLAAFCGLDQRVAATALGRLLAARWVRRSKPFGTDRRTTWYEVREPLLRHYMQYRETRGEPLRVIVGFLRAWYAPQERHRHLASADPGSLAERYLRRTVSTEIRGSDSLFLCAIPEDLISGARCLLDDEGQNSGFALRSASSGIVAEVVALDAWRSRAQALHAARSRLALIGPSRQGIIADTLAAALSATGERVTAAQLLASQAIARETPAAREPRGGLAVVREQIADALRSAVVVADARMEPRDRVTIRLLAAGWVGACGHPVRALKLLEAAAPLTAQLSDDDVALRLAVDAERAYLLFELGRRHDGRELCDRVLAERAAALGADHPDTLTSRSNLAAFTGEAGDLVVARRLYAAVVDDRTRVLGPEHPDTLRSRHGHAYYVGEAGDRVAARDLFADLVADQERVLGADHPHTLTSRHEHAYYVGEAGDRVAARDLFAGLEADQARTLGAEHPDTFVSRLEHAYCTSEAGDRTAAMALFATLAEDCDRVFGVEHPTALASRYMHAYCGGEAGVAAIIHWLDILKDACRVPSPGASIKLSEPLLLALARYEPARSIATGEGRRLRSAADAVLRLDAVLASDLLTGWCEATAHLDPSLLHGAIARAVEVATGAGRATELGAAVMRALPAAEYRPDWIAGWLAASETHDELAVAHRMLRAALAWSGGDSTALLALPAEEQRVVDEIVGRQAPRSLAGWGATRRATT